MAISFRILPLLLATLIGGCSLLPRQGWVPSPNYNERRPNFIIIHQTDSASHERALDILTNPSKQVSAHYLIAKDGRVTQLVDENHRAWHAGKSYWGGQTDMNSASIGIELDHYGDAPFDTRQIDGLLTLLDAIAARHRIPAANYLAHGDVAIGRKIDPNHLFPWQRLAERGYGLWCTQEETLAENHLPEALLGLQALGYDTGKPEDAIAAFRRHFRHTAATGPLNEKDLRMLACLLKKKVQQASNQPAPTFANSTGQR